MTSAAVSTACGGGGARMTLRKPSGWPTSAVAARLGGSATERPHRHLVAVNRGMGPTTGWGPTGTLVHERPVLPTRLGAKHHSHTLGSHGPTSQIGLLWGPPRNSPVGG